MNENALSLKVVSKQVIGSDIVEFKLASEGGQPLGPYDAGAHITLQAPNGMWRTYSLCGAPKDTALWRIAVKRESMGRGGSVSLIDDAGLGDLLPALRPKNFFPLSSRTPGSIFVAGGIGITPIYAMVQELLEHGNANFKIIYCARDANSAVFGAELIELVGSERMVMHLDHGNLDAAFDFWPVFEVPGREHVYCCGPSGLMDAVRDMTGHWPNEQIHFESFSGAQVPVALNTPFEVFLKRSAITLQVPAELSLLQSLQAHGIDVPSSCESGSCGSCRVGLLSGQAQHRDLVLDQSERQSAIMVCVSRSLDATLVLDL